MSRIASWPPLSFFQSEAPRQVHKALGPVRISTTVAYLDPFHSPTSPQTIHSVLVIEGLLSRSSFWPRHIFHCCPGTFFQLSSLHHVPKCSRREIKETMDSTVVNELGRLFREALAGQTDTAKARLRRILPRIDRTNPLLAEALSGALSDTTPLRGKTFVQPPVDADSRQNLLIESFPVELNTEPIFLGDVEANLTQVVREWREAESLHAAGLSPIKSLIFSGPPGVGKTLAAGWLAHTLSLPLLTLDLATVMSSFLGKTGTNLRMVLDYARGFPCVLFLDEFDAIAKRRDDDTDVGELKRLVTVLLQSIDQWPSRSLLIAATNHGELLDPAVWRRFDITLEFPLPDNDGRKRFFVAHGVPDAVSESLATVTVGENFSHLERLFVSAQKQSILEARLLVDVLLEKSLQNENLLERKSVARASRDQQILIKHKAGKTSREIGESLGISHSTVNRRLRALVGAE